MLKDRFMQYINKKHQDMDLEEVQKKFKKFSSEYENLASDQEKFLS